jgi:drug/metabolite transporter (DMT)-like permease
MSQHRLSARQYLILGLVSVCAPVGDSFLARGMTIMPAIRLTQPTTLLGAVFTPWVLAGIALLIGFFSSYLNALSWADLTYVMPATALGNVLVELLSRFWLREAISIERWAGVALVTIGASFVAQGPSSTHRQIESEDEAQPVLPEGVR